MTSLTITASAVLGANPGLENGIVAEANVRYDSSSSTCSSLSLEDDDSDAGISDDDIPHRLLEEVLSEAGHLNDETFKRMSKKELLVKRETFVISDGSDETVVSECSCSLPSPSDPQIQKDLEAQDDRGANESQNVDHPQQENEPPDLTRQPTFEVSELKLLPTKKISGLPQRSNKVRDGDDEQSVISKASSLVSVVADWIALPIQIFHAVVADLSPEEYQLPTYRRSRAQYLSAAIIKECSSLGLQLDYNPEIINGIFIASIDPSGLWAAAPFRTGDKLISLNHELVSEWTEEKLREYWDVIDQDARVTIIVENKAEDADAQWIECMMTKPEQSAKTGIGMLSPRRGDIKISRVQGLSDDTLLRAGDRIMSINDTSVIGLDPTETANLILTTPKHVTVLARTNYQSGYVISTSEQSHAETVVDRDARHDNNKTGRRLRQIIDQADRYHNCSFLGGSWTLANTLQLFGNLYLIFLIVLTLQWCLNNQASIALIVGALVTIVVLANLINFPWRRYHSLRKQKQDDGAMVLPTTWQRLFNFPQITYNLILMGSFLFLTVTWYMQHQGTENDSSSKRSEDDASSTTASITGSLVGYLIAIVFLPTLMLINLPAVISVFPFKQEKTNTNNGHRHNTNQETEEIHAIASLVIEDV